jgi:choline dehydrogenase-like flavoprotein
MSHSYQSGEFALSSSGQYQRIGEDVEPFELDEYSHDEMTELSKDSRRWSVVDKLHRHYGHHSLHDRVSGKKFCHYRCVVASSMLFVCVTMFIYLTRVILFNINWSPVLYDFIIVGGGPSGCILAKKLVDGGAKVLLLEAGEIPSSHLSEAGLNTASTESGAGFSVPSAQTDFLGVSAFDIPYLWSALPYLSELKWSGFEETDISLAKSLGGNSIFSAMISLRATPRDVDKWNIPSVTWGRLLSVYKQQENYQAVADANNSSTNQVTSTQSNHGYGGYLATSEMTVHDKLSSAFLDAVVSTNLISFNPDFNNHFVSRINTIGYYQFNIANGVKSTVADLIFPYLGSVHSWTVRNRNKANRLTIETAATVQKVLFDKISDSSTVGVDDYLAYAVTYVKNGQTFTAKLGGGSRSLSSLSPSKNNVVPWKRNIILSAGAVMTPKILMNSGIGSCHHPTTTATSPTAAENSTPLKYCHRGIGQQLQDVSRFFSFCRFIHISL